MGQAQPRKAKQIIYMEQDAKSKQVIWEDGELYSISPQPQSFGHQNRRLKTNLNALECELESYSFPDPHIKYKIVPVKEDSMAFDVTTVDNEAEGFQQGDIIVWDYHGGPNQQFYLKRIDAQRFNIINVATNFYLGIQGNSNQENSVVESQPFCNAQSQKWELIKCPEEKNVFRFQSFCGLCLTIRNFLIRNGTKVVQERWQNKAYQKWMIIPG